MNYADTGGISSYTVWLYAVLTEGRAFMVLISGFGRLILQPSEPNSLEETVVWVGTVLKQF